MGTLRDAFESPGRKRAHVRTLFGTIADRYDLITVLLSYGQDARWKRRLVEMAAVAPGERALDLACGTGDIALAVARGGARVTGLDITPRMLQLAAARQSADPRPGRVVSLVLGDMGALPCADGRFDLVTTGYGLRNVPDLGVAVGEIARVLRPGGRFLSLDFNRPSWAPLRAAYLGYLIMAGSLLGLALHGDPDTYRYIPESIRRYPGADGVAQLLRSKGFDDVRVTPLLFGLMSVHFARRP